MLEPLRLLTRAVDFAARRHAGQRLKGPAGTPYINHLAEVADLIASVEPGNPELLAAAFLHDVVEDGHATAAEIEERFGRAVRAWVDELTDDKTLPDDERKHRQVEHIRSASTPARLLKLADKISKVREITANPPADWTSEKRIAYVRWCIEVVDAGCRGLDPELEVKFDLAVAEALAG